MRTGPFPSKLLTLPGTVNRTAYNNEYETVMFGNRNNLEEEKRVQILGL